MKRLIIAAVFLIIISMPAFAEELRKETLHDMEAYYGVDSGRLYAAYNPEQLSEVFGEGSVIEASESGFLSIKYIRGGQLRDFGLLGGLIIADPARKFFTVTNGFYNSVTAGNAVRIEGREFNALVREPSRALFEIKNGVFQNGRGGWFLGCRDSEEEYIDCEMVSVVTPAGGYLNITGEGFISSGQRNLQKYLNEGFVKMQEAVDDCMTADPEQCEGIYDAYDLHLVSIGDTSKFEIEALPAGEPGAFGKKGRLFDTEFSSWAKVKLKSNSGELFPLVAEGANAGVSLFPDLSYGIKSKAQNNFVAAFKEGTQPPANIAFAASGGAFIFSGIMPYTKCIGNDEPYDGMGCILWDESEKKISIKPRAITGSNAMPLWLSINIPSFAEKAEIEPFDTPANEAMPSFAALKKEGVSTQIKFYKDDIIVTPSGNWFDLGISFKAYLLPKDAVEAGEQPLEFYDVFECKNPSTTKDCYLNGQRVQGFISARAGSYRCNADSECSAGKKCIDKLCVTASTCAQVPGTSGSGYNVLFVSDEYSDMQEFRDDINLALNGEGEYKGLLEVEPFASNKDKFKFYMINGGNMPADLKELGYAPSARIIRSTAKQCAGANSIIALSKKTFGAHAELNNNLAFISHNELNSARHGKSLVVAHEFGHSFGDLRDEYHTLTPGKEGVAGNPNCLSYEEAVEEWGHELADKAKENWKGCGGICDERCSNLLRPRLNSIMRSQWKHDGDTAEGRGDTFSEPALRQLQEKIGRISAAAPRPV
ncbi:MAG: hypothetical protein PHO02_01335 [Candidatus Nanoarchaeia archaeon]|nr:hypothetical protein [Candidatus Nanoarchaeia archaeon]